MSLEFIHKSQPQFDCRDACHQIGRPHRWENCFVDTDMAVITISGKLNNEKEFHEESKHQKAWCCQLCGSIYLNNKLLSDRKRVFVTAKVG